MFAPSTVVQALLLAYWMTGMNMVLFHSNSSPIDQPAYVHGDLGGKVFAAVLWPRVTMLNREFGWFAVTFAAAAVVADLFLWLAGKVVGFGLLQSLVVWGVLISPIGALPLALVAGVLWLIVSRPLGLSAPSAMSRMPRR